MLRKGMQVGLLLFGIFFGAGNLIFPPSLGFQAGPQFTAAIIGFLITAVGMPVIALIVGTFNPGGFRSEMNRKISPLFSLIMLVLIYLSIGPFMAIPRTATVSFSVGILPVTGNGTLQLAVYTVLYFAFAWWLSITPSKLLSRVGKVLTPIFAVMIIVLCILGATLATIPHLTAPIGKYAEAALGSGFIEGYNTVDTLAAFAFCIIALNTLKQLGFSSMKEYYTSVWAAGASVAVLMSVLYIGLGLLGNHFPIPQSVYHDPSVNIGAYVLTQASYSIFGPVGVAFLAVMVIVTCFTTTVGLITSVAEFFYQEFPVISYKSYVTICSLLSLAVANLGLNEIIKISLPALLFIYPIAISVVLLIIVNKFVRLSRPGMRLTVAAAAVLAVIDILNQFTGWEWAHSFIIALPLGESGQGWLVPVLFCVALSLVLPQKISGHPEDEAENMTETKQ
ncbi:branched-chain amino acid ABC transporter substrate-binding protein [Megasphaera cerevisiae DSM 20462]|jgi:LIVCS family branched-chain amino acid:cation transporter|uniref:Branched-chain amino acid transport system carrier protein n=1 Tax=Megasphaera cerevisiae DSM 20462 TaxID=1122219 RepID=A0A0J6WUL3_9FIRM|nr:branched-chain amino acid transport system II carrier protein [Megasphaera cerevisiae]KMO85462.1 branched-chain amino acid ABC transporter substrate-binding protein [Megasphaera cerevisiae DSM 20462]MCI1750196.1 branched-chain amino acid transport system II carrier protein [Megasphaera cerevisiae]SKA17736.1 branched-chain amino acid:cation transporter, LIVCS family [Megasphaera cerevisiae DSM 20462]